jgi:hypothetical protein
MNINDFKACAEVASALGSGVSGLGGDTLGQTLAKAAALINTVSGVAQIAALAVSMMQAKNVSEGAEAVATATAVGAIPVVGWERVAMATAVTATAGAIIGSVLTYNLRADLKSPSGITALGQTIGGIA